MSPLRSGNNTLNNLYVGSDAVQKIYSGSTQVWPATAATQTFSHRGATFDVEGSYTSGVYGDGSAWVRVLGVTSLTTTTPTAVTESGTIDTVTYVDADLHGLMLNPGQTTSASAALSTKQQENHRRVVGQGWDGRVRNLEVGYVETGNIDPGKTGSLISLSSPASYVKAVSHSQATAPGDRAVVQDLGVLTVVSSEPSDADSCRPSVALPDKSSRWRTSDIVLPSQDTKSYTNLLDYTTAISRIGYLQHMIDTDNTRSRAVSPGPSDGYGGTTAQYVGEAAIWLIVGSGNVTERTEVARSLCQMAEDVRGRVLQGGVWNCNGGWSHLAQQILSIANSLLPGLFIDALNTNVETASSNLSFVGGKGLGDSVLGEYQRVEVITQDIIDLTVPDLSVPFEQKQLGWPEWCSSFGTSKSLPGAGGDVHETLENILYAPGVSLDGGDQPQYRHITMKGIVPTTLFLRLINSSLVDTYSLYFDYVDRHMQEIITAGGDYSDIPGGADNPVRDWVIEAWIDLRGVEEVWSGAPVQALLGQSENVIGVVGNQSNYTAQTYPALANGVDARIAIRNSNEDLSTGDKVVILNTDSITNREVNPGFVAMANLWHAGSGGVPLRLVDINRAGTSMFDMMDDDALGRDFDNDTSVTKLASVTFGSVSDVYYNWWNSEASAAKTLWESRSAAFFGVQDNGSDYDFAGTLEHCLIDTTDRGFGLLPQTTKVHMFMPGVEILSAQTAPAASHLNYTTDDGGAAITGRIAQNGTPAFQERIDFLTDTPVANAGQALISPALVRFGDYQDGVQLTQPAQTDIHPSVKDSDGQLLFSQDVAAGMLIAQNYIEVPILQRVDWDTSGMFVDLVFSIPDTATLTTQRQELGETVPSPRPHQQEVMGFVLYRSGDTDRTARPLYRTDNIDDTAYPPAYRGTAVIQDSGSGVGGSREGVVRVTPTQVFSNGDILHFGTDGQYGGFSLDGYLDYDARLYRDGLRAHIASLDTDVTAPYPGVPVRNQEIITASGITGGDVVAPSLSIATAAASGSADYTGAVTTDEGNGTLYWLVNESATAPSIAVIKAAESQAVSTTGSQSVSGSGLSASTTYYIHYVHTDLVGNDSIAVSSGSFDTTAASTFATKSSASTARYTGPAMPSSTSDFTIKTRMALADGSEGNWELIEYASQSVQVQFDARNGRRSVQFRIENSAGSSYTTVTADGSAPTTMADYVLSATHDDGSGNAVLKIFINGVEIATRTEVSLVPSVFPSNRSLTVLDTTGSDVQLESLDIWHEWTATGVVSGFGAPVHSVSGNAAAWNAATGSGLTKIDDPFT